MEKKLLSVVIATLVYGTATAMPVPFESLDTDRNGSVTKQEIESMRSLTGGLVSTFDQVDTDRDGSISQKDYQSFTQLQGGSQQASVSDGGQQPPSSAPVFETLDVSKDGMVSETEYEAGKAQPGASAMSGSGPQTSSLPSFESLDTDRDNFLNRAEVSSVPDLASKFDQADTDRDARLSRTDYDTILLTVVGVPVLPQFSVLDINRDGMIIPTEYVAIDRMIQPGIQQTTQPIGQGSASSLRTQNFQQLDTDKNGSLSASEVTSIVALSSPEKFATADVQKDGELNVSEFINATSLSNTGHAAEIGQSGP